MTKRMSGLISLTLSKLTLSVASLQLASVGLNFKVWYKKETRLNKGKFHFPSFIEEVSKGFFVRTFVFSSDFFGCLYLG